MIYLHLFAVFFKIGLFTFGGGYAMIPMIQQNILRLGWATEEQLIDFIAISESTPGPFAVNIATFIGMERASLLGATCATLGVILPSFLIILLVATCFQRFQENIYVKAALYGLRAAVIGLIASAALSIFLTNVFDGVKIWELLRGNVVSVSWMAIIIGILMFIFSRIKKGLHPIFLILISGILGILFHLLLPGLAG
ncbi:MAG: chromate transporter [Anaerotruncus sp.]|nr:chromate transporter [Anaerotruncus sp.]